MKYVKLLFFLFLALIVNSIVVLGWGCYDCGNCNSDNAYTSFFDQWPGLWHEGSGYYDGIVWGSIYLDVTLDEEDYTPMVECFDWTDDGDFEHCYASSSQALSDCRDASSTLDDRCNGDTDCYGSGAGNYHEIDTGDDGDYWGPTYITIQYYYDCDPPSEYCWYRVRAPYHVIYRHQYNCDGSDPGPSTDPDYEGDYSSWLNIKANTGMCYYWEECDENHDSSTQDGTLSTVYDEVLDSACRTKNWYSCSSDPECISDKCEQSECSTCSDSQCTSAYWNSCTNNGAFCCSTPPGEDDDDQYYCEYYETWVECTTETHTECQQKGGRYCTYEDSTWAWRTCPNGCSGSSCNPTTETSCTDYTDNDVDGSTDCDDSDCEGETGPNGKTCCNDGAFNCGTCKYCSNDECENRAVGYVCISAYKCSDYPGGDNSYDDGSNRKIPSQGQCNSIKFQWG